MKIKFIPQLSSQVKKTEKTFEDNMLKKLSKITDLMSRLDALANGPDCRVHKHLGEHLFRGHCWLQKNVVSLNPHNLTS